MQRVLPQPESCPLLEAAVLRRSKAVGGQLSPAAVGTPTVGATVTESLFYAFPRQRSHVPDTLRRLGHGGRGVAHHELSKVLL